MILPVGSTRSTESFFGGDFDEHKMRSTKFKNYSQKKCLIHYKQGKAQVK